MKDYELKLLNRLLYNKYASLEYLQGYISGLIASELRTEVIDPDYYNLLSDIQDAILEQLTTGRW